MTEKMLPSLSVHRSALNLGDEVVVPLIDSLGQFEAYRDRNIRKLSVPDYGRRLSIITPKEITEIQVFTHQPKELSQIQALGSRILAQIEEDLLEEESPGCLKFEPKPFIAHEPGRPRNNCTLSIGGVALLKRERRAAKGTVSRFFQQPSLPRSLWTNDIFALELPLARSYSGWTRDALETLKYVIENDDAALPEEIKVGAIEVDYFPGAEPAAGTK